MGFALRITQAKGGLGVVENKACMCMLYFFFLVRCSGGVRARKSENQKITFRFSDLSASPLMASVGPRNLPGKISQAAPSDDLLLQQEKKLSCWSFPVANDHGNLLLTTSSGCGKQRTGLTCVLHRVSYRGANEDYWGPTGLFLPDF
jgi:hypothetical protein